MATRRILTDVAGQFASLNRRGERLAVMHGYTREFRDRRYSIYHKNGGKDNHFQGVQRLGNYLLVSGSYPYRGKRSDLLVIQLGSRAADPGPWGSNMMRSKDPLSQDTLVNYFAIDKDYWHPGGFSLLDSVAAIPLENSQHQSRIVFLDLQDPKKPSLLTPHIDRPEYKAGACAITPLADDKLLLAVWSDSDKPPARGKKAPLHLDIYLSSRAAELDSLRLVAQFYPPEGHDFHRKFQCLDFVWQSAGDTEQAYLIAFENTAEAQPNPIDPGVNKSYLFEVDVAAVPTGTPRGQTPKLPASFLKYVDDAEFDTSGNWCNMDAGACAYVDSNQQLIVYSVYHFLERIRGAATGAPIVLKTLEFRATDFATPITRIEDAWVELYEDPGLQGPRLALLGPWDSSIEDTERIYVNDKSFTTAASARSQIPADRAFVLYTEKAFGGEALVLQGTGARVDVDLYATGFGGEFRSCRFLPKSVAAALPGAVFA